MKFEKKIVGPQQGPHGNYDWRDALSSFGAGLASGRGWREGLAAGTGALVGEMDDQRNRALEKEQRDRMLREALMKQRDMYEPTARQGQGRYNPMANGWQKAPSGTPVMPQNSLNYRIQKVMQSPKLINKFPGTSPDQLEAILKKLALAAIG